MIYFMKYTSILKERIMELLSHSEYHFSLMFAIIGSYLFTLGVFIFLQWQITALLDNIKTSNLTMEKIANTLTELRCDFAKVLGHEEERCNRAKD